MGARFTDMDVAGLQKLIDGVNTLGGDILATNKIGIKREAGSEGITGNRFAIETEKIWQTGDVRVGRGDEVWLNAIIRKK